MEHKRWEVTEVCPNCDSEITMVWDVNQDGYKAYCPVCGKRLMLCDECHHRGEDGEFVDDCDYDRETDTCRFNSGNTTGWTSTKDALPAVDERSWRSVVIAVDVEGQVSPLEYEKAVVRGKTVFRWKHIWGRIYGGAPIAYWMPLPEAPRRGGFRMKLMDTLESRDKEVSK